MNSILIGLLAGTHTSSWGMYKDAPHEGFTWPKYFRSIVVATLAALVLSRITGLHLDVAGDLAVLFGLTYVTERATLEAWKTFLREEDQSKYFIPMQFGVKGKPIKSRAVRWSVIAGLIVVIGALAYAVNALQHAYPNTPAWLVLATVGAAGGWLSAFGGAWKDAPVEGFETLKFFRSPLMAMGWATVMAFFTTNWIFLAMCGLGYTIATIETYKTFFFPNKPRGKFAGKPILYPKMLKKRRVVAVLYATIWAAILTLLVVALSGPHYGLLG
jgi:hypothetical protein